MSIVRDALAAVKISAPQIHRNLVVFPLIAESDRAPYYLLLDQALERKIAEVSEVSAQGSVPELAFENRSSEKILLIDGDELIGAKQNRILNVTILVSADRKLTIPVACVEAGRWRHQGNFSSSGSKLFAKARSANYANVTRNMSSHGGGGGGLAGRFTDQYQVWNDVAAKAESLGAASATSAMSDVYQSRSADVEEYVNAFRTEPGQCGVVVAVDGTPVGVEMLDSPAAFSVYLAKLIRSYALDAIETLGQNPRSAPEQAAVRQFLDTICEAKAETFTALGEGEDVRLSGKDLSGGALVVDGRVVHLAGFSSQ